MSVVLIKCPYSVRDSNPTSVAYIKTKGEGFQLDNYYFQVQGQLAVFERAYSDFVCWTPQGLYIERINYDPDLLAII